MTNQILITIIVVMCSLGGWYVVLGKYLELKAMLKAKEAATERPNEIDRFENPVDQQARYLPEDLDFANGQHIPGMGPPPLANMPFNIPPELLATLKHKAPPPTDMPQKTNLNTTTEGDAQKRLVCNWASVLHISGLALVTGIPFLNIILPTILWLIKKEQHPYLAKQGREVINFQITLTVIQFLCLGLGALFIWILPSVATGLFAWTKTLRVVFATGMHLPFNIFTVVPFFWGCGLIIRGAVAAYNGLAFKYPYSQPFLFTGVAARRTEQTNPIIQRKEPQLKPEPSNPGIGKISFG